ncbi:MAG: hypothetical protein ABW133_01800 [Polyangiaceae bacterium]
MPSLRSILFLLTIWAFAMGCGSEKPAPFVGDSQNNKSDASTTMPDAAMPDVVTADTDVPIDTGSQPPNLCTDAGNCSVILTAERLIIPADGKSTNLITATVGDVRLGGMIDFSITGPGRWENNRNTIPALVDTNGKARATFSSDASGGTAIVTARLVGRDMAASLTIEMPQLADITYTKQHTLMGVNSSGFNESNNITFKILAPNGAPYPAGLTVNLEHKPLSGSKINNKTCTMLDCAIKETGVTDDKGLVNVVLDSGQLQGTAIVSINATAGGQTKNVTVDTPIVGAKVSGRNVSIECTPRNVPALVDTDCIRSRVDTPFKCTVTLGDRFNNVVGVSTTVKYQSEAGIVGTPPTTPQYPNPDLGKATGTIGTVGGVLPVDVFPIMGEFSMQMDDNCHPAGSLPTHNPRDGIVSVIAMVAGEEGFIDKDGDGTYDMGEPFIDLPEPFVDSNDNGVLDPGEFFQDLNMDFQWNPANNVWDSSTTLWTETRVVYTGKPEALTDMTGTDFLSRYFFPGTPLPAGSLNVGRIELMPDEGRDLGLWFSDWNFNVLAPTVKYSVEIGMGDPITASLSGTPPMRPEREEGFFFAQQYCDGAAPASCGMVCPPTPATQRCLVKSAVTQFEYGARGSVRIKASASLKGGFGVTSVATLPNAIGTIRLDGVVK